MTLHAFLPRELPDGIELLTDLALDLRWTWSHGTDDIWRRIDPVTWEATHNPWVILQSAPGERLEALAADAPFRERLATILAARQRYSAMAKPTDEPAPPATAYFSIFFKQKTAYEITR